MTERHGLRWEPWPAEAGAWFARTRRGQAFVARPTGGGYALFYGGQHVKDYADAGDFQSLAAAIETMHSNAKGTRR